MAIRGTRKLSTSGRLIKEKRVRVTNPEIDALSAPGRVRKPGRVDQTLRTAPGNCP